MPTLTDPLAEVADYQAIFPGGGLNQEIELRRQLVGVSRYVEYRASANFGRDAADVARVYVVPHTAPRLQLPDFSEVPSSILIDTDDDGSYADETELTGYELARDGDRNARLGSEVLAWNQIHLRSFATPVATFTAGQRVQITVQWGWPAVPEAVRLAVIHLTAILRIESPRATATVDDMNRVIGMSSQARGIIDDLLAAYGPLPGF